MKTDKLLSLLIVLLLGVIYLLFPTQNAGIDSWYYAASVKYGNEIWNSHHLMYSVFGNLIFRCVEFLFGNLDALKVLFVTNTVFAIGSLLVFRLCLFRIGVKPFVAVWFVLIAGSSFGFMRYATDAETYIVPLFFSLVATYYAIIFNSNKHLFLSIHFAVWAVLFHQLHIWWLLALIVYFFKCKVSSKFLVVVLGFHLVLGVALYYLGYHFSDSDNFWHFITGEYHKGNADIQFSWFNLLLLLVNFIRTFIQVHGNGILIIKEYPIVIFIISMLIVAMLLILYKTRFIVKLTLSNGNINLQRLFAIAFLLHLFFAFLSSANAEFMVMLPFLAILFLVSKYHLENIVWLSLLGVFILVWNLCFGLIPNYYLCFNNTEKQIEYMKKHKDAYFLWENKPLIENKYTYINGFNSKVNLLSIKNTDTILLDSLCNAGCTIFTDFTDEKQVISRSALVEKDEHNKIKQILSAYTLKEEASYSDFYGQHKIYLLAKSINK